MFLSFKKVDIFIENLNLECQLLCRWINAFLFRTEIVLRQYPKLRGLAFVWFPFCFSVCVCCFEDCIFIIHFPVRKERKKKIVLFFFFLLFCFRFFWGRVFLLKEKDYNDMKIRKDLMSNFRNFLLLALFCGSNANNVSFLWVDGDRLFSVSWVIGAVLFHCK